MALPIGVNLSRSPAIARVRQGLKPLANSKSPLISFSVTPEWCWLLTVDCSLSTVNSQLEFTIPMLTDLIWRGLIDISKKASIEQARCLFHNKRFKEFFSPLERTLALRQGIHSLSDYRFYLFVDTIWTMPHPYRFNWLQKRSQNPELRQTQSGHKIERDRSQSISNLRP